VEGCPVQDNPFSIFDPKFFNKVPACPFCKTRFGELSYAEIGEYDPARVDPKAVPVSYMTLREGHEGIPPVHLFWNLASSFRPTGVFSS
jgi:hypothetical protein